MNQHIPSQPEPENASIFYTKQVAVRIVEKPQATARLYRGNSVIQQEVLTKGLVLHDSGGDLYPIRFIHDRTIRDALYLRVGDVIKVTQGRFRSVIGRREMELHVKGFHRMQPKSDL